MKESYIELDAQKVLDLCHTAKVCYVNDIQDNIEEYIAFITNKSKSLFSKQKYTRQEAIDKLLKVEKYTSMYIVNRISIYENSRIGYINEITDMAKESINSGNGKINVVNSDFKLINYKG